MFASTIAWATARPTRCGNMQPSLLHSPDVVLASSSVALAPLLETTRTVPIVFAGVADPVAAGYVESLARPGGNATGFTVYEYSIIGKWLE